MGTQVLIPESTHTSLASDDRPQLAVKITSPKNGDRVVGKTAGVLVTVEGTVVVRGMGSRKMFRYALDKQRPLFVTVRLGDQDHLSRRVVPVPAKKVNSDGNGTYKWSYTGPTPSGGSLKISATATLPNRYLRTGALNNNWLNGVTTGAGAIVGLQVANDPWLTVDSPSQGQMFVGSASGCVIQASGRAFGSQGIENIVWTLDSGPENSVKPEAQPPNTQGQPWSVPIPVPNYGSHILTFVAHGPGVATCKIATTIQVVAPDLLRITPGSYLQALVDFAIGPFDAPGKSRVVTDPSNNTGLTLDAIENTFYQPIAIQLQEQNTAKSNEKVHQARVCVEVLRRYVAAHPADSASATALARAETDYRQNAYCSMLRQVGTSFDEIRLARTYDRKNDGDRKKLQAIADRLGIELGTAPNDHLNSLFFDPALVDPSLPGALTENTLEQLFGLVDTTRDPFSQGATIGDSYGVIKRWAVEGAEWNRSTDSDGIIYVGITGASVSLYSDGARTKLVASGVVPANLEVRLTPVNDSGVSGCMLLAYGTGTEQIALSAFPRFLSWQFQYQRNAWLAQDCSPNAPVDTLPIVDPDLLAKCDFKHCQEAPYTTLYEQRSAEIGRWGKELYLARKSAVTPTEQLNAMLTYSGSLLPTRPGGTLSPLKQLQNLDAKRQTGYDITSQLGELNLSVAAFDFILRLGTLAERNMTLLDSEWDDLSSILIQVLKRREFPAWRATEKGAEISVSPDYFNYPPAPPAVFSTGLDSTGITLADGSIDPHWTIVQTPKSSGSYSAYVTNSTAPIGERWIPNSLTSRWISPQADESGISGFQSLDLGGTYIYRTTVDLNRYEAGSVCLDLKVAAASKLTGIKVNGKLLTVQTSGPAGFQTVRIENGFQSSWNTLDFVVENDPSVSNFGPSGLRVEISFATPPSLADLDPWRTTLGTRQAWQGVLNARITQRQTAIQALDAAVDTTEEEILPQLRTALISICPSPSPDWLSERLLIDNAIQGSEHTTRLQQAIQMMQSIFVSLRNHEFEEMSPQAEPAPWVLAEEEVDFDGEWLWMSSYSNWRSIMRVFFFPENLLLPTLRPLEADPKAGPQARGEKTHAFNELISRLSNHDQLTPQDALSEAQAYLSELCHTDQNGSPDYPNVLKELRGFGYEDPRSVDLNALQSAIDLMYAQSCPTGLGEVPTAWFYCWEACYFVPVELALELQKAGECEAALDWFRTVYAWDRPPGITYYEDHNREIFPLSDPFSSEYQQPQMWLVNGSNPHQVASVRSCQYKRFTIIAIVSCLLDFADTQFARNTAESFEIARILYLQALDLLDQVPIILPADFVTTSNPLPMTLRRRATTNLAKLRSGRNLAGLLLPRESTYIQPTQYRYSVLIERAKQLVTLAEQIQTSFLIALEKKDAESYTLLKAQGDLAVARDNVTLAKDKAVDAQYAWGLAWLQRYRAGVQQAWYQAFLSNGVSAYEQKALDSYSELQESGMLGAYAQACSMQASFERRQEEWMLQLSIANVDYSIADWQMEAAATLQTIAGDEQIIANDQATNAADAVTFLASKFTNAALYDWMAGVLQGIYSSFLQRATSVALLAEHQLSFERLQPALGIIQTSYLQSGLKAPAVPTADTQASGQRGLT